MRDSVISLRLQSSGSGKSCVPLHEPPHQNPAYSSCGAVVVQAQAQRESGPGAAMVMLFGLARRTARQMEKASLFYLGRCKIPSR